LSELSQLLAAVAAVFSKIFTWKPRNQIKHPCLKLICAGRNTHVVFMMPRNPFLHGQLLTARDLTSDALFLELQQAVHGASNWYFSSSGETSPALGSFLTLNEPALQSLLRLADVRCVLLFLYLFDSVSNAVVMFYSIFQKQASCICVVFTITFFTVSSP
jgi:hypothetical protein